MKTKIVFLGALLPIIMFTVVSASATELISNGGFETMPFAPWATTNATRGWFNFNSAANAYSGNRYEYIGRESDGTTRSPLKFGTHPAVCCRHSPIIPMRTLQPQEAGPKRR